MLLGEVQETLTPLRKCDFGSGLAFFENILYIVLYASVGQEGFPGKGRTTTNSSISCIEPTIACSAQLGATHLLYGVALSFVNRCLMCVCCSIRTNILFTPTQTKPNAEEHELHSVTSWLCYSIRTLRENHNNVI